MRVQKFPSVEQADLVQALPDGCRSDITNAQIEHWLAELTGSLVWGIGEQLV